jgi:hypothetical protein
LDFLSFKEAFVKTIRDDDADPGTREAELASALTGTTFNWVDNLANLRAMAHATTAPVVVVEGYSTGGDGGGGMFLWNATSTLTDNDGTIVRPNDVAAASPGRWIRLYSGPVNVRWFGGGLGLGSDVTRIMSALAMLTATGGELFFPAGTYATSSPIDITTSNITLRGESPFASTLSPSGAFDTIRVLGSASAPLTGINIKNLYFFEPGKTAGNSIFIQYSGQCLIVDCQLDGPSQGVRLHSVNTVEFERVRIAGPTGVNSYGFWITGDATAATDVVTFKNVVVQGNTGTAHSTHGLIVDGRVNTLSAYKLYLNEMDGAGLWFRNTMGSADPEFATFYGLEIERPFFEAIQIAVGNRFYFTDAQLFGSATRTNVTIAAPVTGVSFSGGWSVAAHGTGFDVSGQQVSINAVDVESNGGAGIQLNGTSRVVSVVGNKVRSNPTAINIAAGADHFTVVGNTCFDSAAIINGAGAAASRIVTGNAS